MTERNGAQSRIARGGHRSRWAVLAVLTVAVAMIAGVANAALVSDTGTYTVEVSDRTGFAQADLTPGGAIVQYIGDENETFGAAGSGVFESFVRVQADGTERGYNTDANKVQFDTKKGGFTHSILLSDIPTVIEDGESFWEIFADINDSDSTPLISLDDVELWLTDDPDQVGYVDPTGFPSPVEQIYDFTGTIKIHDVNQGSGRGDLRYLFPQDGNVLSDCTYGNPDCETYLILYSKWGGSTGCSFEGFTGCGSDGGFEEWKVKKYVVLNGVKYKDMNADGDRQSGEPGLAGWTINLYADDGTTSGSLDAGDTLVESIVTPANGFFSFTVDEGDFLVCEVTQSNWVQTEPSNTVCGSSGGYARSVDSGDFGALTGDFGNTPLSNFDVRFFDLTGSTNATISCVKGTTSVGTSSTDENASPETTLTANGQTIGTYVCTIAITDP